MPLIETAPYNQKRNGMRRIDISRHLLHSTYLNLSLAFVVCWIAGCQNAKALHRRGFSWCGWAAKEKEFTRAMMHERNADSIQELWIYEKTALHFMTDSGDRCSPSSMESGT